MKTEKKEFVRTIKEIKDVYIAFDGEEFTSEEQCRNYEESARYAYRKRLGNTLKPIDSSRAYVVMDNILDDGRNECDYYSFKPKTEDDLRNFIAYAKETCGGYVGGNSTYYETHPNHNHFYIRFEDMKINDTYIFFQRYGEWGGVVSRSSLLRAVDMAFDEKLWEPIPETPNKEGE